MLYKKIHRQFVRQFRVGRRYWHHDIYEITKKPRIGGRDYSRSIVVDGRWLINLGSGRLLFNKDDFEWLD